LTGIKGTVREDTEDLTQRTSEEKGMRRLRVLVFAAISTLLLLGAAVVALAEVSAADQQVLRTEYVGKVLIFRKSMRMASNLEYAADGTLKGNHEPGFWTVDGAVQVKDINFGKDHVTLKCVKLWANIKPDGQLHYFPASAALKGKSGNGYPEAVNITLRVEKATVSADEVKQLAQKIFLGPNESMLSTTPRPIAAFIQKVPIQMDIDPVTGMGFSGTPPKPVEDPTPERSREAKLVGQAGRESFIVYVDTQGRAAILGFTHLLQYGLEETTIDAVRNWRFQPAVKDGKPVAVRIPMSIDYKLPEQK
jgi:hypothetical protein